MSEVFGVIAAVPPGVFRSRSPHWSQDAGLETELRTNPARRCCRDEVFSVGLVHPMADDSLSLVRRVANPVHVDFSEAVHFQFDCRRQVWRKNQRLAAAGRISAADSGELFRLL